MSIFRGQDIYTKVGEDISRPNYIHYTKVDMLWSSYIQQSWCRYFEPKYTKVGDDISKPSLYTLRFGCLYFNSKLCIPMLMSIFRGQAIYTKVGVDISSSSYVHQDQGWCRYFKAKLHTVYIAWP